MRKSQDVNNQIVNMQKRKVTKNKIEKRQLDGQLAKERKKIKLFTLKNSIHRRGHKYTKPDKDVISFINEMKVQT